jgi:hypothetical protein
LSVVERTAKAYAGGSSTVTQFTIPDKVDAEKPFSFTIAGHLDSSVTWPNFSVAFWYEDGPMSEIAVVVGGVEHKIPKGNGIFFYVSTPSPCTTISENIQVKGLSKGTYSFAALTGYVQGGTFAYDDRVRKTVEAVEAAPPTPPVPEIFGIPWYYVALAGGIAVVGIVGAVVYESERQKEMMMFMMMR